MTSCSFGPGIAEQKRGADSVKIVVFRKGRAYLSFMWAAAHAKHSPEENDGF
jgi:hypothetical protein